jgi:hypothetical protein
MFFKQVSIRSAFSFFQTVSTFNRFAVWLTVFENASGERAFLFIQTASTFCQSGACFIVSKVVYSPSAGGSIHKTLQNNENFYFKYGPLRFTRPVMLEIAVAGIL